MHRPSGHSGSSLRPAPQELLVAFFGCNYAAVIAVPYYPPVLPTSPMPSAAARRTLGEGIDKVARIYASCAPSLLLSTASYLRLRWLSSKLLGAGTADQPTAWPEGWTWRSSDDVKEARGADADWLASWLAARAGAGAGTEAAEAAAAAAAADGGEVSFLQYTSGSTGHPKGVVVRTRNLMANVRALKAVSPVSAAAGAGDPVALVSWLPQANRRQTDGANRPRPPRLLTAPPSPLPAAASAALSPPPPLPLHRPTPPAASLTAATPPQTVPRHGPHRLLPRACADRLDCRPHVALILPAAARGVDAGRVAAGSLTLRRHHRAELRVRNHPLRPPRHLHQALTANDLLRPPPRATSPRLPSRGGGGAHSRGGGGTPVHCTAPSCLAAERRAHSSSTHRHASTLRSRPHLHTPRPPSRRYALCVRRAHPSRAAPPGKAAPPLSLSHWRAALNGAEPIRAATLRAFCEAFGPCGFRPDAFACVFGPADSRASAAREAARPRSAEIGRE